MALKLMSLLSIIIFSSVWAFAGEHGESKGLPKITNETYRTNCGGCHFAYQPGLLPARSWQAITDGGHPGGGLSLDKKAKAEIRNYLTQNSAERSNAKRSRKILASLGSSVPTRISEVPYIREKHHEIDPDVFLRKAIGSRGNCIACHKTAANGDYDDDNVAIPK